MKTDASIDAQVRLLSETRNYLDIIREVLRLAEQSRSENKQTELIQLAQRMLENYDNLNTAAKQTVVERATDG